MSMTTQLNLTEEFVSVTTSLLFRILIPFVWGVISLDSHAEQPKVQGGSLVALENEAICNPLFARGKIEAPAQLTLRTETSGVATWLSPSLLPGRTLSEGLHIATLDDETQKNTVEKELARVAMAKSKLELNNLELQYAISLKAKNAIAQISIDRLKYKSIELEATLALAQADLELALMQLDKVKIYTPRKILVQKVETSIGEFLRPGDVILEALPINVLVTQLIFPESGAHSLIRSAVDSGKLELYSIQDSRRLEVRYSGAWVSEQFETSTNGLIVGVEFRNPKRVQDSSAPAVNGLFVQATLDICVP